MVSEISVAIGNEGLVKGGIMPKPSAEAPPPAERSRQRPAEKCSHPFREKIGRAQIKKCRKNFFAGWRSASWRRAAAGLISLVGVLLKKSSNFVQKTPPSYWLED